MPWVYLTQHAESALAEGKEKLTAVESAIRIGDVFALMVEWCYSQQQMEQAYTLIEKMRSRTSPSS